MTWNPNHTPCTPAWWNQWGCAAPPCSPCSWTVPPGLPQPVAPMSPYYPFAPYAPPYPGWGFDNGCCSAPPLPWAPPQLPPPYARLCPSYYVGGACCDECAQGSPCAGTAPCCEECANGLPCAGSCPASPMPIEVAMAQAQAMQGPHVGLLGSEEALPWSDVAAFDGVVRQFDTDVRTKGTAGMRFLWEPEVTGFWPRWRAFFDATKDEWTNLGFIAGQNLARYRELRAEFNALVDQMRQAGLQTSVNPVDVSDKSAFQTGLEEGGKSAGQGAGAFGAALGDAAGKIALYAAIGGALYFLGPPLLAKALKKRKAA